MREIIFRGRRADNGEWVTGDLRHGGYYLNDPNVYIVVRFANTVMNCPVDPATVGQYTGLYDDTKWEDLTDAEKLDFYHQHYIGEDGMSVRFQCIDDVKPLWRGKRIFEGDILECVDRYYNSHEQRSIYTLCVKYFMGRPCVCFPGCEAGEPLYPLCVGISIEVIGNIADNPELLEGGVD